MLDLRPDRLGHGTCIYPDRGGSAELVDLVLRYNIPLGKFSIRTQSEKITY